MNGIYIEIGMYPLCPLLHPPNQHYTDEDFLKLHTEISVFCGYTYYITICTLPLVFLVDAVYRVHGIL